MKKGLIVLFILVLVACAFFVGSRTDYEEALADEKTNIYTTEEDSMAKAELVGVWWSGFYDTNTKESISGNIISFDDNGEINLIWLDKQMELIDHETYTYEIIDDTTLKILHGYKEENISFIIEEEEILVEYPPEDNSVHVDNETINITYLYLGDKGYVRCEETFLEKNKSIVGSWRPINEWCPKFSSFSDLNVIDFYSDGTLKINNIYDYTEHGEYKSIYDGSALKFYVDGEFHIYEYKLVGTGLMLISCNPVEETSNDVGIAYTLLERIA